jgi:hypothetical protein
VQNKNANGRLKKVAKISIAGIFQVVFYRKADGTNPASVFSDGL